MAPNASEFINEAAALMSTGASADQLADAIHAHPTIAESMMEATADALERCMHLPPGEKK